MSVIQNNTISTNSITEATSANGVSIDGLKVKDSALVTDTNKYPFVKSGELNSLGYLNQNFFGASYYLSTTMVITSTSYHEVTGTWTKMVTSGASGSDDADPFGKFASGRWTPTVSGFYLIGYTSVLPGQDTGHVMVSQIRRNGNNTAGHVSGNFRIVSYKVSNILYCSSTAVLGLDTNDYVSLWVYNGNSGNQNLEVNATTIHFTYLGTSDL
tara:strand:+ start:95 stop:733 length:639 start_codon:yes stop_codon:yes gene_type:complete